MMSPTSAERIDSKVNKREMERREGGGREGEGKNHFQTGLLPIP